MQRDQRAYLWDICNSADLIWGFVANRTLADYQRDPMLRSAVERQLEIIGEALAQLVRRFPETAAHISRHVEIISFRNFLIHGYSFINDEIVWSVIHTDLPVLRDEVNGLLSSLGS
jgi:uncharacterized protein with HEPN domain